MIEFVDFARIHGLLIDHPVIGIIGRCATEDKPTKKNASYFYQIDWGWVQNHRKHAKPVIWISDKEGLDQKEIQVKIRKSISEINEAAKMWRIKAKKKAQFILSHCKNDIHSYLARKGFPEMDGQVWLTEKFDALLVIPMYFEGELTGCQLIDNKGVKKFLKGQRTKGAYFKIGSGSERYFVEGYATGLSLQRVLGALKRDYAIYVCFSAQNSKVVAQTFGGYIIADNDESKTGEEIASSAGLPWWMPPEIGTDLNDYVNKVGIFKASNELRKFIVANVQQAKRNDSNDMVNF